MRLRRRRRPFDWARDAPEYALPKPGHVEILPERPPESPESAAQEVSHG